MDELEIYGEKHQTKRLIMDLTEEDVDIISISSQEEIQNQTKKLDNDKCASPERREVSMERGSPVLTTNRGFSRIHYNPILEIKEELQEIIRKEKHFENSESDEVEEDLFFPEQSKDTREEEQIQSQLVKEKENRINMQKSKPKWTENLKAICPNSVELLSENNNNDLEIINKTLEPLNKLVNGNNSGNEVTRQFNPDTTKFDRTTINPIIESEAGKIRHEVSKTNTCTTKQIDNKNKVNNCEAVVVQSRSYGKVVRRSIRMNMTMLKYFGLTNFPLRADKKINVRKLKRKQNIALSRTKQLAKKAWIRIITKSLTRKTARRQPKSIPTTEEKDEIKMNNVRRTMETPSETISNGIEQQLEKDEKTLLQKLKNELSNKQEILLRRKHIKHMRKIVQQLEKENVGYKAADEQTGQRQLEITRAINMYYQLKNESTMYEDNFVIKDLAGYDAIHVKFTIKELRPEGYREPCAFHTMYDLVDGRLRRRTAIMMHTNDCTLQMEELPVVEVKPSTSEMADGNKKELSGKKRKISSFESNSMEEVQTPNEKKKKKEKKNKIDISSKALKHATAIQTRGNDGKFKPTEEQTTTSTNKQTRNKQKIISTKDLNLIPKNLQQELSFKKILAVKMMKLPALDPTSTALLKPKEPETGNQLPESQPAESAMDEPQNPQIMNNNQAMATSSEEDAEKQ